MDDFRSYASPARRDSALILAVTVNSQQGRIFSPDPHNKGFPIDVHAVIRVGDTAGQHCDRYRRRLRPLGDAGDDFFDADRHAAIAAARAGAGRTQEASSRRLGIFFFGSMKGSATTVAR